MFLMAAALLTPSCIYWWLSVIGRCISRSTGLSRPNSWPQACGSFVSLSDLLLLRWWQSILSADWAATQEIWQDKHPRQQAWKKQFADCLYSDVGPVVRITPDEIHLSDPDNYERIHHVGSKYSKCPQFYGCFGLEYGTFITPSSEVHRQRRGRLNPLFSRKMVLELEGVVQSKAEKLCTLLDKKFSLGLPVDLHHGFRAISVDVITDYGFNKCYDLLDEPDLGLNFFAMVQGIGPAMWISFKTYQR